MGARRAGGVGLRAERPGLRPRPRTRTRARVRVPRRGRGRASSLLVVLVTCAGALASGCGRDPWVVDGDRVVRVELREYRISPQRIRVREGRVVVLARNRGRLLHALQITNDEDARGGRRRGFARSSSARTGRRLERLRVRLRPGRYRLLDPLSNFEDLGMSAELEVLASDDERLRVDGPGG